MEIPVLLLDIGPTELDAGLSYVGASRSNHPRAYCVHPFPSEKRFNRIGALTSGAKEDAKKRGELKRREAACQRIAQLAQQTIATNRELYDWCAAHCKGGRQSDNGLPDNGDAHLELFCPQPKACGVLQACGPFVCRQARRGHGGWYR